MGKSSTRMIGIDVAENFVGYGRRFRFVDGAIMTAFPSRDRHDLRVLDIGCGNGSQMALPLARRDYLLTGIDMDPRSIERARRLAADLENAQFVTGTLDDLKEGSFDVVLLAEVLEHVLDPQGLLAASLSHLQPKGIVIITVPNGYGEFEIDSWIYRKLHLAGAVEILRRVVGRDGAQFEGDSEDVASTDNQGCGHVQFFTRKRLKRIFANCSLTLLNEAPGSFMCGPMVAHTLGHFAPFIEWNARITDRLPITLASGWYFVLQRLPQLCS